MKTSENFKIVIENYLKETARNDSVFAVAFAKTTKNTENCIQYILSEVKKTGLCAFADNEIFTIAIEYYNNDNITKPTETNCKVIVSESATNDLFSTPIESAVSPILKSPVKQIHKPVQKTLTLFDL